MNHFKLKKSLELRYQIEHRSLSSPLISNCSTSTEWSETESEIKIDCDKVIKLSIKIFDIICSFFIFYTINQIVIFQIGLLNFKDEEPIDIFHHVKCLELTEKDLADFKYHLTQIEMTFYRFQYQKFELYKLYRLHKKNFNTVENCVFRL